MKSDDLTLDVFERGVAKYAEEQAAAITARAGKQLAGLERRVIDVVTSNDAYPVQHRKLVELASEAAALVAPNTPCVKGCADCCYQAVPISLHQARILASASGRPIREAVGRPAPEYAAGPADAMAEAQLANPTPCPFLKNNACSVYEHRPVNCRVHHVLHRDSSRCSLFHHKRIPQAKFNLQIFDSGAAAIAHEDRWADIRDFFPPLGATNGS